MREVLETLLTAEGYRVDLAKTGEEGLEAYGRRAFDVVLLDVSMPGIGGLRALEEFLKMDSDAVIVMITAYATFDTAIAAWERGAFGCIRKPFQNEQITATIAAGIKRRRKEEERRTLRRAMSKAVDRGEIVGRSDVMQEVFRLVEQVAPARSTVLITGESGTGKELIAKAIHEASPRAGRPFVTVNSSNIPSELLESELFGHTRGAFTGAVAAKKGLFEVADGGSIFLDEIGDIPPETQVRLLRVIQEREFTPLGDTTPRRVDVRIIAATNIDLKEAVRQGSFREDLYYRLSVVPIELPPLRDRHEDILPLAQHFIQKYNEENGAQRLGATGARSAGVARVVLVAGQRSRAGKHDRTRGRDCARRRDHEGMFATEISDPKSVVSGHHDGASNAAVGDIGRGINFYEEVRRFEIDLIRRALEQTGGHQSRAARLLGMNATTLNSKIKTYNINLRP